MKKTQRTIGWLLVLILAVPTLAGAGRPQGKMIGKVLDPEGEPIAGVKVFATCKDVSRYDDSDITNKRGVFKIEFPYLDVVYVLRFEKDGYFPLESEQSWNLDGTAREDFTLFPGEATVANMPVASTSNMAVYNFNLGVEAFNSKDYDTAEAKFREALEHDAKLHQAWAALSKVNLKRGRYQEAADAAEKAIELGATDEAVWRSRWEAYRSLGDDEKTLEALKDLEDAGIRAEEAKRIHNEAVALEKAGDHEGAFAKFKEALEVDPNLTVSLVGVATTGLETGRDEEAAKAAETILAADPGNEQAIRIRYNAALNIGDTEMISDALVGLAAVEPEVARDSLLKLAFDAYDANDMALAGPRFEKVLEVAPDHALSHYLLGLIYVNEGDNEQSMKHLERFLELAPDDKDAATARELLDYLKGSS